MGPIRSVGQHQHAAPTGRTNRAYPGSLHLFPQLCIPTATLRTDEPPTVRTSPERGLMMHKRRHTRAHNTAQTKAAERRLNDDLVARRNNPPPF